MTGPPLILTLALDKAARSRFEAERRTHFPPERNLIPAHLTLFHNLPGTEASTVAAALATVTDGTAPFPLRVTGLRFLGRGVAYECSAPALLALRGDLAARWAPWLTPQDRQPFRPHVTVQNKVDPTTAHALFDRLRSGFEPYEARAEGLLLWRYLGGPWKTAGHFPFRGQAPTA